MATTAGPGRSTTRPIAETAQRVDGYLREATKELAKLWSAALMLDNGDLATKTAEVSQAIRRARIALSADEAIGIVRRSGPPSQGGGTTYR